eukprot:4236290-Pyramimonas_sp.AAC.1
MPYDPTLCSAMSSCWRPGGRFRDTGGRFRATKGGFRTQEMASGPQEVDSGPKEVDSRCAPVHGVGQRTISALSRGNVPTPQPAPRTSDERATRAAQRESGGVNIQENYKKRMRR